VSEPLCRLESSRDGSAHVIVMDGEIDMSNVGAVEAELRVFAAQPASTTIVVLDKIRYLDTAAIAALERVAADTADLRLVLARDAPTYRALTIAGLHRVAPIHETIAEACD
jgi:anti-anti-sigma factor